LKKYRISMLRAACAVLLCIVTVTSCILAIPALAASVVTTVVTINSAPLAENMEFSTFKNIPITGNLSAVDPDGDLMAYYVTGEPKKGTVELTENGGFVYTPMDGKKGRDTFTYAAVDTVGNRSQDATVTIDIRKQSTKISYSDMDGESSHYAALCLAEADIFTGDQVGGLYFFRPGETISRGEFLAMCMKLCGEEALPGITRTGFYDDADMPLWVKPYVAAALMSGAVSGYSDDDGRPVFLSGTPITFAEASVMLDNILEITDVSYGSVGEACPSWAYQATINLSACNIASAGVYGAEMTRADAAEMLLGAMNVLDARGGGSLLSWAK